MNWESFSEGDSLLHRADARAKVAAAVAFACVTALCERFGAASAAFVLGAGLLALARLDAGTVLRRLAGVSLFLLFLWLVLPFSGGGEPLFAVGPLTAQRGGVLLAALVSIKCLAIVMAFMALVATSPVPALGRALRMLGVPQKLCLLLLFSYRYVFVIHAEFQRLKRAARMRGFVPRTNLHTYRTYGNLVGMTLVRSWNRAERVRDAMALRGFAGVFHSLDVRPLAFGDAACFVLLMAGVGAVAALEWMIPLKEFL